MRDIQWWSSGLQLEYQVFVAVIVLVTSYLTRILYLVYFHPLSKFSGPTAAAYSTRWIYKLSEQGNVEAELQELHEKYGQSMK
jgi:hypothetical protein